MGLVKQGRVTVEQAANSDVRAPSAIVQLALVASNRDLVKVNDSAGELRED